MVMTSGGPNLWIASFRASRQKSAPMLEMGQARPFAREPIRDGHQIEEPLAHRQVGYVGAPYLIWPINAQPAQQTRVNLVRLGRLDGVGFLVDRHGG